MGFAATSRIPPSLADHSTLTVTECAIVWNEQPQQQQRRALNAQVGHIYPRICTRP